MQHYKTLSDLPSAVVWDGDVYEVCTTPKTYVYTWGVKTADKLNAINNKQAKKYSGEKRRVRWRWYDDDGKKAVLCPFTDNLIPEITNSYLISLPDKYNRYAPKTTWFEFTEAHPSCLIEMEVYSLDHMEGHTSDGEGFLRDQVPERSDVDTIPIMNYDKVLRDEIHLEYEFTFHSINECIKDPTDQYILKLATIGYQLRDIADALNLEKKRSSKED